MSDLLHPMETRRRSRSKTPFLRSACDHENCEHAGEEGHVHHKKKTTTSPKVQTIVEETEEVVTKTRSSGNKISSEEASAGQNLKSKTSDYFSEDGAESKGKGKSSSKQTKTKVITTTTTMTSTQTAKSPEISRIARTGVISSTPNNSVYAGNGQKEISQNVINAEKEKLSLSSSFSRFFTRSFNSTGVSAAGEENENLSDHLPYRDYKKVGEYWNKTPKTDYTYSELSSQRRELAPGIVAMPNMSRRGLDNHSERVQYMIQKNPEQESFIRRRYENNYAQNHLIYESGDDELDTSYFAQRNYNQSQQNWFLKTITIITTFISNIWSKAVLGSNANLSNSSLYRTRVTRKTESGFLSKLFVGVYSHIYQFVARVLYWDTVLLQSSGQPSKNKKRFLLALLVLLPFLLLAGLFYYLNPNEPFPPTSFSQITNRIPTLSFPELPKIDMSEFINQEKYNELKDEAFRRYENVKDWTDDYILYLRTISQNLLDRSRDLFRREEYYERV